MGISRGEVGYDASSSSAPIWQQLRPTFGRYLAQEVGFAQSQEVVSPMLPTQKAFGRPRVHSNLVQREIRAVATTYTSCFRRELPQSVDDVSLERTQTRASL